MKTAFYQKLLGTKESNMTSHNIFKYKKKSLKSFRSFKTQFYYICGKTTLSSKDTIVFNKTYANFFKKNVIKSLVSDTLKINNEIPLNTFVNRKNNRKNTTLLLRSINSTNTPKSFKRKYIYRCLSNLPSTTPMLLKLACFDTSSTFNNYQHFIFNPLFTKTTVSDGLYVDFYNIFSLKLPNFPLNKQTLLLKNKTYLKTIQSYSHKYTHKNFQTLKSKPTLCLTTKNKHNQSLKLKYTPYILSNSLRSITFSKLKTPKYSNMKNFLLKEAGHRLSSSKCYWLKINTNIQKIIKKWYNYGHFITSQYSLPRNNHTNKNDFNDKTLSRVSNNLTLSFYGLFVYSNLYYYTKLFTKKFKMLYIIKKQMYSFTKPNQVKNIILRRKSTLFLYKLIFNNNNFLKNNNTTSNYVCFKKTTSIKALYQNYFQCRDVLNIISYKSVTYKPKSINNIREVKIPRIRFKPGYQRIWRESRLALKDLIGLRFIYQKQLTNYLFKFYRNSTSNIHSSYELAFDKLVVYSNIVPDVNTFNLFFNSKLFFINSRLPLIPSMYCVVNDFIQLVVSKWYYIFFRWVLNWVLLRSNKVKRLIYKKGLASRYKVMKSRKQKSQLVPDWIFRSRYDFSDIKPFIEVDFFTLSFFIIYEPYLTYHYSPTQLLYPKTNLYRLYNWKYIT